MPQLFKAKLIPVEGDVREIEILGSTMGRRALERAIGCAFMEQTRVRADDGAPWAMMVVDSDGHPKGLPRNERATALLVRSDDHFIAGDVVVFDFATWEAFDESFG